MLVLLALAGIALVFFILLPGLGAVLVRRRWRLFRNSIIASRDYPLLDARNLASAEGGGLFRFFGSLEAIEQDEVAWLKGESFRVPVSMRREELYILRGSPLVQQSEPGQILPQRLQWDDVENLAEGTSFFVFGKLVRERGRKIFARDGNARLLVVAYEGRPEHFVSWAIWSGRQRNEYWNHVTPVSLLIGSLLYLILTIYLTNLPIQNFWLAVGLSAALVPVLPLFPPGIGLFLLYRRSWRRGRTQRAIRDVLALPLMYFYKIRNTQPHPFKRWKEQLAQGLPGHVALLPDGSEYTWRRVGEGEAAKLVEKGAQVRAADIAVAEAAGDVPGDPPSPGQPLPTPGPEALVFGSADVDGGTGAGQGEAELAAGPHAGRDPMAEFLITPPDVQRLVLAADKKARTFEALAVLAFVGGFGINVVLVHLLLWQTLNLL